VRRAARAALAGGASWLGTADPDEALAVIRSLDIEAFRNLVHPEEEAFLRGRLPAAEFRRIKRERSRAALTYVAALSEVSLQFVRLGEAAQRSPVPAIAASGKQLANSAVYLRLRTLDARARLTLATAFPDLATEMISVGEQTGALPQMLNSVAEFFEEDVATALTAALSLIEPAILIVMGVVVVFILISLYLPIFSLGSVAGGQG